MFVSRKNLPFIHFIPAKVTARFDMAKAPHECIYLLPISRLGGEVQQPFPKGCVEGFALRPGNQSRLLDQIFVGAESYVFHTITVYTKTVYFEHSASLSSFLCLSQPALRSP